MRLVQLTDLHLGTTRDALVYGVNTAQRLDAVVAALVADVPDMIILTGDIADAGGPEPYRLLLEMMGPLTCPWYVIAGNHDDDAAMARELGVRYMADRYLDVAGWRLWMLNSKSATPAGALDQAMLPRIESSPQPHAIFVHHPPLPVGSPWIDIYGLHQPEALMAASAKSAFVACGHVHQVFDAPFGTTRLLCAPPVASVTAPGQEQFTDTGEPPGWREFSLESNGDWATSLFQCSNE